MKSMSFIVTFLYLIVLGCNTEPKVITINSQKLLENAQILSHDSMEGRGFSKPGSVKAQKFIEKKFREAGLLKYQNENYIIPFNYTFKSKKRHDVFPVKNPESNYSNVKDTNASGANIIGFLKGQTNKTIVITAHYDHLGIINNKIYNGADDNASGVSALFTIANYFKNKPTKHNLLFAAVDGEEIGSIGTEVFLKNYKDKKNIAININMDMISHSDYYPELYACGIFYNPILKKPLEDIKSNEIKFLFGHDDPGNLEQTDWTLSSDHKVFYREKIPFLYFGVEDHKDYHRPTDKYATINTTFYIEVVKVIIQSIENLDIYLAEK